MHFIKLLKIDETGGQETEKNEFAQPRRYWRFALMFSKFQLQLAAVMVLKSRSN